MCYFLLHSVLVIESLWLLIRRRDRQEERAHGKGSRRSERGEEAKVSLASGLTVACQACSGMDKHKSQSLWDEKGPCVSLTHMHKECLS